MTIHIPFTPKSNRLPVAMILLLVAALSSGCASDVQPVAARDPIAGLMLAKLLTAVVLFIFGALLWYFIRGFAWKSIRDSARIYAAHYLRQFNYYGDTVFQDEADTSWNGQSFSYQRMDVQLSILADTFALSGTALLTGFAKTFTLPRNDVWEAVITAAIYIILFLPVYFAGAKWIGNLANAVLHYPKDKLVVGPQPGQFRWLLVAGAITAAWCGVLFGGISVEPPPPDKLPPLFAVAFWVELLAAARIAALFFKVKQLYPVYFSPSDTFDHFIENGSFSEMEERQRALTAEICAHPALARWQASLPPGPRRIAARVLDGYASMELLAEADACSEEELRQNPFLLALLYGAPQTLPYTGIVHALYEIRDAVKTYQYLSVFHLPAAPA